MVYSYVWEMTVFAFQSPLTPLKLIAGAATLHRILRSCIVHSFAYIHLIFLMNNMFVFIILCAFVL